MIKYNIITFILPMDTCSLKYGKGMDSVSELNFKNSYKWSFKKG